MNRIFLFILILGLAAQVSPQQNVRIMGYPLRHEYVSIDLDSTSAGTLWVTHRSITKLTVATDTSATVNPPELQYAFGDLSINILPDTVTAQESDSLSAYIKPLMAFHKDSTAKIATNDSTFLVFDTAGTFTSTSIDYLDWTHHKSYHCDLTGEIPATQGFVVIFNQKAADVSTAYTRLNITLSRD